MPTATPKATPNDAMPTATLNATPDDAMPNATLPRYTPAAYSVTLGGGLQSEAPFRYLAPSALGQLRALDYVGVNLPLVDEHRSAWVRASSTEAWAAAASAPVAEGEGGELTLTLTPTLTLTLTVTLTLTLTLTLGGGRRRCAGERGW